MEKKTEELIDNLRVTVREIRREISRYLDREYPMTAPSDEKGPRVIQIDDFEPGGLVEQLEARGRDFREIAHYILDVCDYELSGVEFK